MRSGLVLNCLVSPCFTLLFFCVSFVLMPGLSLASSAGHCFEPSGSSRIGEWSEIFVKLSSQTSSSFTDQEESFRSRIRSVIQEIKPARDEFSKTLEDSRLNLAKAFHDHLDSAATDLRQSRDQLKKWAADEALRAIEKQSLHDEQFLIALVIIFSNAGMSRSRFPTISDHAVQRLVRIAQGNTQPLRQATALQIVSFLDIQSENVDQTLRTIFQSSEPNDLVLSRALEIYEASASRGKDLNDGIGVQISSHAVRVWKQQLSEWRSDSQSKVSEPADAEVKRDLIFDVDEEDVQAQAFQGEVIDFSKSIVSKGLLDLVRTSVRLASYQAEDPRYQNKSIVKAGAIQEIVGSALKDESIPSIEASMIFNTVASYASLSVLRAIVQQNLNQLNLESPNSRAFVASIVREYLRLEGPDADPRAISISNQLTSKGSLGPENIEVLTATLSPELNRQLEAIRQREPNLSQAVDQALELGSFRDKPLEGQDLNTVIALGRRNSQSVSLRGFLPQLLRIAANPAEPYERRTLAVSAFLEGNWPPDPLRNELNEIIANETASMKEADWKGQQGQFVEALIAALPVSIWQFAAKPRISLGIL